MSLKDKLQKGALISGIPFLNNCSKSEGKVEVSKGVDPITVTIKTPVLQPIMHGLFGYKITGEETSNESIKFLPYVEGSITYCEPQGKDILSGPFSGCIMASYKRNKILRVCHVFKDKSKQSLDCNEAWEKIKKESDITEVLDFSPMEQVGGKGGGIILGLITSTLECYAFGCVDTEILVEETRSAKEIAKELKDKQELDIQNIKANPHMKPDLKERRLKETIKSDAQIATESESLAKQPYRTNGVKALKIDSRVLVKF